MTYRLDKISDLLQVPIDRREDCVRDLLYALALHEMAFGDDAIKTEMTGIAWTDDGDRSATVSDQHGNQVLALKITKDAP